MISQTLVVAVSKASRYLFCFPSIHRRLDLGETFANEEGSVDEHAVGGAVDFKVAKQNIGAKQRQDLIDAIVGLALGGDVKVGGVGGERREGVCGATSASSERENGEVSWRNRSCQLI